VDGGCIATMLAGMDLIVILRLVMLGDKSIKKRSSERLSDTIL